MSIGINYIRQNCYYVDMGDRRNNDSTSWLMTKYLDWQRDRGALASMAEFARYLDVGDKALNTWINGRNNPSYENALKICQKTNDFSLLDILGYSHPDSSPVQFSSLPPEFVKLLEEIDLEIAKTFRERGITEYSTEAESIAREIMEKYGANVISTKKSGNDSN